LFVVATKYSRKIELFFFLTTTIEKELRAGH